MQRVKLTKAEIYLCLQQQRYKFYELLSRTTKPRKFTLKVTLYGDYFFSAGKAQWTIEPPNFETKAWTTKHFHNTAEANKQFIVDKSTGGFRQDILLSFIAMHIFSLNSKVDIFRKQIRFLNFLLFVIVVLILLKVLQLI